MPDFYEDHCGGERLDVRRGLDEERQAKAKAGSQSHLPWVGCPPPSSLLFLPRNSHYIKIERTFSLPLHSLITNPGIQEALLLSLRRIPMLAHPSLISRVALIEFLLLKAPVRGH
jgi:hypothetical protein